MKRHTMNRFKLLGLLPNQFEKTIINILDGKFVYRTHDNRLIDFGRGTEKQLATKAIRIRK